MKNWPYRKGALRGLVVGIILALGIYPTILLRRFDIYGDTHVNISWLVAIVATCVLFGVLIQYLSGKLKKKQLPPARS